MARKPRAELGSDARAQARNMEGKTPFTTRSLGRRPTSAATGKVARTLGQQWSEYSKQSGSNQPRRPPRATARGWGTAHLLGASRRKRSTILEWCCQWIDWGRPQVRSSAIRPAPAPDRPSTKRVPRLCECRNLGLDPRPRHTWQDLSCGSGLLVRARETRLLPASSKPSSVATRHHHNQSASLRHCSSQTPTPPSGSANGSLGRFASSYA